MFPNACENARPIAVPNSVDTDRIAAKLDEKKPIMTMTTAAKRISLIISTMPLDPSGPIPIALKERWRTRVIIK
jgi:hypothetical protein